jgi:hypothetical protein
MRTGMVREGDGCQGRRSSQRIRFRDCRCHAGSVWQTSGPALSAFTQQLETKTKEHSTIDADGQLLSLIFVCWQWKVKVGGVSGRSLFDRRARLPTISRACACEYWDRTCITSVLSTSCAIRLKSLEDQRAVQSSVSKSLNETSSYYCTWDGKEISRTWASPGRSAIRFAGNVDREECVYVLDIYICGTIIHLISLLMQPNPIPRIPPMTPLCRSQCKREPPALPYTLITLLLSTTKTLTPPHQRHIPTHVPPCPRCPT